MKDYRWRMLNEELLKRDSLREIENKGFSKKDRSREIANEIISKKDYHIMIVEGNIE